MEVGEDDILELSAGCRKEWCGGVVRQGELDGGTAHGRDPCVGSVVCSSCGDVLKPSNSTGDVMMCGEVPG